MPTVRFHPHAPRRGGLALPPPIFPHFARPVRANDNAEGPLGVLKAAGALLGAAAASCTALGIVLLRQKAGG